MMALPTATSTNIWHKENKAITGPKILSFELNSTVKKPKTAIYSCAILQIIKLDGRGLFRAFYWLEHVNRDGRDTAQDTRGGRCGINVLRGELVSLDVLLAVCLLRIVQRTQKLLPPLSRLIQPPISITNAALNLLSNAAYVLTAAATTAQW
jgi:hypothetical protein